MHELRLLLAIAAALPRVHRAPIASGLGRAAGCSKAAHPVVQQLPGHSWQTRVQVRKDVELVPEDVAAVGLTVQPASEHAGIQFSGVWRAHLEDVRDVEPK